MAYKFSIIFSHFQVIKIPSKALRLLKSIDLLAHSFQPWKMPAVVSHCCTQSVCQIKFYLPGFFCFIPSEFDNANIERKGKWRQRRLKGWVVRAHSWVVPLQGFHVALRVLKSLWCSVESLCVCRRRRLSYLSILWGCKIRWSFGFI